jgi:hypothetical protein
LNTLEANGKVEKLTEVKRPNRNYRNYKYNNLNTSLVEEHISRMGMTGKKYSMDLKVEQQISLYN